MARGDVRVVQVFGEGGHDGDDVKLFYGAGLPVRMLVGACGYLIANGGNAPTVCGVNNRCKVFMVGLEHLVSVL